MSNADQTSSGGTTNAKKTPTLDLLWDDVFNGLRLEATPAEKSAAEKSVTAYVEFLATRNSLRDTYNILILFDQNIMIRSDADKIYSAVTAFKEKKPILLVLSSNGGSIPSAYLIGKLCRESAKGKLVVAIPRSAKSAATLLCCAADEIHMGSLSELGPIDPQIDKMPALGLKSAIEHLAELLKENPIASDMFAKYLHLSVQPMHLGYYERVAESAVQYAQRLLSTRNHSGSDIKKLASDLVYSYKDHSFVIDKSEAAILFSDEVIKTNTPEYDFANSLYQVLDTVRSLAESLNHLFYLIGSLESSPTFFPKRKS
jgi:ClpP class serine protease